MSLDVRKTYKLYVNGAFPVTARAAAPTRSPMRAPAGTSRTWCSGPGGPPRRGRRGAGAQSGWAKRSVYNRGQILYRVAEVMQGRRDQFVVELRVRTTATVAGREVDAAIHRWVWYAGWADKFTQIACAAEIPSTGRTSTSTVPEPVGVVGAACPDDAPLLALVSRLAPCIVSGNTTVVLASEAQPLVAVTLAEALATSDVPAGVINILTGRRELVPWLAGHADVDTVDLTGCTHEAALRTEAERAAAESVTPASCTPPREAQWLDDTSMSPYTIGSFVEYKTVWHPKGP